MNATLDINGTTLHWRQDGDPQGAPVLLLNSLGTDLHLWDAILPHLPGHRVIRMDTRGHGRSAVPAGDFTLAQLVADATALIDHLSLPRLSVVGVSLGGMMAQALAAQMPDRIARVVLSNTAPRMGTPQAWAERIAAVRTGGIEAIADTILDRWFAPAFRASPAVAPWRAMLTATPPQGYAGCCAALASADLSANTTRITCPALVIAGALDGASPPAVVRPLAAAIPGARYHEFAACGHLPMAESPDQFGPLIHAFLTEVPHA